MNDFPTETSPYTEPMADGRCEAILEEMRALGYNERDATNDRWSLLTLPPENRFEIFRLGTQLEDRDISRFTFQLLRVKNLLLDKVAGKLGPDADRLTKHPDTTIRQDFAKGLAQHAHRGSQSALRILTWMSNDSVRSIRETVDQSHVYFFQQFGPRIDFVVDLVGSKRVADFHFFQRTTTIAPDKTAALLAEFGELLLHDNRSDPQTTMLRAVCAIASSARPDLAQQAKSALVKLIYDAEQSDPALLALLGDDPSEAVRLGVRFVREELLDDASIKRNSLFPSCAPMIGYADRLGAANRARGIETAVRLLQPLPRPDTFERVTTDEILDRATQLKDALDEIRF